MNLSNRDISYCGESSAAQYLFDRRYKIIARNYRKPYGEIDIIVEKDGTIRFIEVKTSKYYPDSGFTPEIRVNKRKIRNLKRICETYISEHKFTVDTEWQIDVISVILDEDGSVYDINHIENAVFESKY